MWFSAMRQPLESPRAFGLRPRAPWLEVLEHRRLLSGSPALSISDVSLAEGNSGTRTATLFVSLNAPSTRTVSVNYGTANGTAAAGSDYDAVSGKMTFAPGETRKSIAVQVRGDRLPEPGESFLVKLQGAKNAAVADGQGVVAIADDEPRVGMAFDAAGAEGNSGTTPFTFTVNLSAAYDQAVSVNYATADGTATTADGDYSGHCRRADLRGRGDRANRDRPGRGRREGRARGNVLRQPQRRIRQCLIDRGRASGTIRDDEPRIFVSSVGEWEGVSLTFTVSLSAAYAEPVTIDFATRDGTATAGQDYVATSGTLTFAAGERFKTITVATLNDYVPDGDESFILNLTGTSANALNLGGQCLGMIYDLESWGGYGDLYGGW